MPGAAGSASAHVAKPSECTVQSALMSRIGAIALIEGAWIVQK
jgi:hypothetical protein